MGCSSVLVDKVILSICLFEGISNARKYCEPNSVLSVRVTMEGAEEAHGSVAQAPLHWLHIELDNVHCTGVAPLSAEQCLRVFYASLTKATRVITARQPALAWA